jgi:hypothetical protein
LNSCISAICPIISLDGTGAELTLAGAVLGTAQHGYSLNAVGCNSAISLIGIDEKMSAIFEEGQDEGYILIKAHGRVEANTWYHPSGFPLSPSHAFNVKGIKEYRFVPMKKEGFGVFSIEDGRPVVLH